MRLGHNFLPALDFVAAQTAFQPADRRKQELEDAVRYGDDPGETKTRIDLARRSSIVLSQYAARAIDSCSAVRVIQSSDSRSPDGRTLTKFGRASIGGLSR